jgi:hypothetical protein
MLQAAWAYIEISHVLIAEKESRENFLRNKRMKWKSVPRNCGRDCSHESSGDKNNALAACSMGSMFAIRENGMFPTIN